MIPRFRAISLVLLLSAAIPLKALADVDEGLAAYEKRDFVTAMREFKSSAQQGDAYGQAFLGTMYSYGEGVSQDYKEAARWLRLAAGQGNAGAQYNLGLAYAIGQGVPQDYKEAVRWYRLAADQGIAIAQNNLGWMYENGQGITPSRVIAFALYNLSAANDSSARNKAIDNRTNVAEKMSLREIEAGQDLTRELFKPKNFVVALDKYTKKSRTSP